jgi:hypothetical protein
MVMAVVGSLRAAQCAVPHLRAVYEIYDEKIEKVKTENYKE